MPISVPSRMHALSLNSNPDLADLLNVFRVSFSVSLSVITIYTVLFEIPNFFAAALTVDSSSIMNIASSIALSSIYSFKKKYPLYRLM